MNQEKLEKINKIIGNKSNILFRESYFKNNFESLTNEILNYTKDLNLEKFPQKVWHWVNEKEDYFKCEICNINKTKFNKNWLNGYKKYCSAKCAANSETTKQKRTKTCLEIYGFDNVSKNENIKKKTEETNIKKYGYKSTFQNENVRNKWKKTIYDKYGVEHYFQSDEFKNNNEKYYISKYNVNHQSQLKSTQDKIKKTNKNKYGVECYLQTNHARTAIKYYNESNGEKEIKKFLKLHDIEFIEKNNTIIYPKELDIYIPEYNLAIEYNGLYWHSEKYKDKNYHLNKTILCREKNIHLIHVWEDEWKYKKEIIKSIILNKLDKSDNIIYARKCTITQINDNKVVEEFLKNNDINGYFKGDIYLGLYYKNELINITSFKKKINKNIEIVSICNKLNYKIIDNFSKIFKYFIKNYEYNIITSSTDISKFEGDVYKNTGFILKETTKPNSWYIDYDIRTKIKTNNIRIYGCGYHKWIYKKNIL